MFDELPPQTVAALPAQSQDKLARFVSDRSAAHAVYRDASDAAMDARQDAGRAKAEAKNRQETERWTGPPGVETGVMARRIPAPDAATAQAPVDAAERRLQLATEALSRAAERQSAFDFVEGVVTWLRQAHLESGQVFELADPVTPPKAATVASIRAELEALEKRWGQIEQAPVPIQVLRTHAIAEIDDIAARGALTLSARNRTTTPLNLARQLSLGVITGATGTTNVVGTAGGPLFVHLMRDRLVEQVDTLLAALPQDGALTDDQRDAALAELLDQRLMLERLEECLVERAERAGQAVARRADADPRSLLGIQF